MTGCESLVKYKLQYERQQTILRMSKEVDQAEYNNDSITLLKVLKKTVASLDSILANEQYNIDSSSMIYKISEESKILLQVMRRQKNKNSHIFIINNERMKLKFKQWLLENRNKYANGYLFKDIRSFLQQIQVSFGIFEKNQEFVALVNKIYNAISDQLRIFKIKYDLFQHKNPYNLEGYNPKVRKNKSLILNSNFLPLESVNLMCIYGLDLDFTYLKSTCILGKRNQMQYLHNQLQRNREISKNIDEYIKDYYLLMNRLKLKRKHNSELYSRELKSSGKNLRIKTTMNDKNCLNFENQKDVKRTSSKENRQEIISNNKLAYKINNVYVSGNEFDIYSDHSNQFMNANRPKKKGPTFLTRGVRDPLANRVNNFSTKQLVS